MTNKELKKMKWEDVKKLPLEIRIRWSKLNKKYEVIPTKEYKQLDWNWSNGIKLY